ncbi:MAG: flagellar biosynthetic protein FliO, partial [Spirochaetota bacterium]|nr:flagellar biosynthetic protein FliO [Spirochaetota bacterium]
MKRLLTPYMTAVLSLALAVLLSGTSYLYSQKETDKSHQTSTESTNKSDKKTGEKVFLKKPAGYDEKKKKSLTPETSATSSFFKSIFILLIFLLVLYVLFKWIQKKKLKLSDPILGDGVISVLKSSPITNNKTIQLVEIGNKIYILGLGEQNISLISVVEDPAEIVSLKDLCNDGIEDGGSGDFKTVLKSYF